MSPALPLPVAWPFRGSISLSAKRGAVGDRGQAGETLPAGGYMGRTGRELRPLFKERDGGGGVPVRCGRSVRGDGAGAAARGDGARVARLRPGTAAGAAVRI